jgi:hypothetical protein
MRLYPRFTVEHNADHTAFDILDNIEHKVIDSVPGLTKAYGIAAEHEVQFCVECGVQPRTGGTSFCIYCYVRLKS